MAVVTPNLPGRETPPEYTPLSSATLCTAGAMSMLAVEPWKVAGTVAALAPQRELECVNSFSVVQWIARFFNPFVGGLGTLKGVTA